MPLSYLGKVAWENGAYADAAAAAPEALLPARDFVKAGAALDFLAASAGTTGAVPVSAKNHSPDPIASLWFIRGAHLFGAAGGDGALASKFVQLSKRMLQDFIAGRGLGGVKMDDGGLLMLPADQPAWQGLRLNTLWYSALESTAKDLKKAGDKGGDHFERLAGRFRRAFAKSFWCDGHNCICPPYRRIPESHGEIPDAEQLLLTVVPSSPIPRTKQRQLLQLMRSKSLGGAGMSGVGLLIDHPTLGRVESLLHRAWLAVGLLNVAENRAAAVPEARAVMTPLQALAKQAGSSGLVAYYKNGRPVDGLAADGLTTAHVLAAIEQVRN